MSERLRLILRRLSHVSLISASRFFGALVGFVTQVFLARLLPTGDLGLYFFATSLAAFLAVLAGVGLPSVTTRFLIRYQDRKRANLSRLFLRTTRSIVLAVSALVAALALIAVNLWPGLSDATRLAASYGVLGVPALAMCRVGGTAANALRRFNLSFLPDLLLRPVLFLALIGILSLVGHGLSLPVILFLFALLAAAQALFQNVAVARLVPADDLVRRREGVVAGLWLRKAAPLVSISLLTAIFADVVILFAGFFLGEEDLALFGICIKITVLVGFVQQTVYQLALPDLAEALKRKDGAARDRSIVLALGIGLGTAAAALIAGLIGGEHILSLFGPDFVAGKNLLVLLLAGQVLIAAAGPGVQLLTLADGQSRGMIGSLVAVTCLLVLDFALIPVLGLAGAAIAVIVTNAIWSVWLAVQVRHLLGIRGDIGPFLARMPRKLASAARN